MDLLTRSDIMSMDEFEQIRSQQKNKILEIKRHRRLAVGPDITFYFENKQTLLWQIHEMLRIEKGGEAQIEDELHAFSPLMPRILDDGTIEIVATMMIEIEEEKRRRATLEILGGIETCVILHIENNTVIAQPEMDVERTTADGKTSAIHFLRFKIPVDLKNIFCTNNIHLAIAHSYYTHQSTMPMEMKLSLMKDFSA